MASCRPEAALARPLCVPGRTPRPQRPAYLEGCARLPGLNNRRFALQIVESAATDTTRLMHAPSEARAVR